MGTAKPKESNGGIVDLSNDKAWQSRLEEARARRAQVLKEAGHDAPRKTSRTMPWEDADGAAGDEGTVDFHDRMNRFKRLSGLGAAPERSAEDLAKIDRLLSGRERTLRLGGEKTQGDVARDAPVSSGPVKPECETATQALILTAADEVDTTGSGAEKISDAASTTPLSTPARGAPQRRKLIGGWFVWACLVIFAAMIVTLSKSSSISSYFWDTTPPTVQASVSALPLVVLDDLGRGAKAPQIGDDALEVETPRLPSFTPPTVDKKLGPQIPAPKPFASL